MNKIIVLALLLFALIGCSSDKKAEEMLDTARFEEKQHNLEHATQLYQDVVKTYPGTPSANEASTRLEALKRPMR